METPKASTLKNTNVNKKIIMLESEHKKFIWKITQEGESNQTF